MEADKWRHSAKSGRKKARLRVERRELKCACETDEQRVFLCLPEALLFAPVLKLSVESCCLLQTVIRYHCHSNHPAAAPKTGGDV